MRTVRFWWCGTSRTAFDPRRQAANGTRVRRNWNPVGSQFALESVTWPSRLKLAVDSQGRVLVVWHGATTDASYLRGVIYDMNTRTFGHSADNCCRQQPRSPRRIVMVRNVVAMSDGFLVQYETISTATTILLSPDVMTSRAFQSAPH